MAQKGRVREQWRDLDLLALNPAGIRDAAGNAITDGNQSILLINGPCRLSQDPRIQGAFGLLVKLSAISHHIRVYTNVVKEGDFSKREKETVKWNK